MWSSKHIIKPPLVIARAAQCIGAVHLFVCLSVCLSVCRQNAKKRDFLKTKHFRAMVSIDDLQEVVHGLFKEPIMIIGPLKSKMAEIRHLGSWRQNAKTRFSGKLSNLVSCNWDFQSTHYWIPKIQDGWDLPSWKTTWRHFFLPRVVRFG